MSVVLAILLLITAVATVIYWIDFFVRGSVHVVEEEWYIRFERAFPVADLLMAAVALAAAIGLLADSSLGTAFGLVAAGALLFLGLLDVTFNVDNRLYRLLPGSGQMWVELVINIWSIGLGVFLLVVLVGRV